jgi:protein-serine/threonine kinase
VSDVDPDIKESKKIEKEYTDFVDSYQRRSKKIISIEDFEMLKVLGMGAYGKVFLVKKQKKDTLYAMKVIKKERIKTQKQRERTRTERWILEKLTHPFIMNLKYAFQTPTSLFMVIDYCPGGELFFHLQHF